MSLPAQWTSLAPPDPFVIVAVVRSAYRVAVLRELARLDTHREIRALPHFR